jgi:hypothetical protein
MTTTPPTRDATPAPVDRDAVLDPMRRSKASREQLDQARLALPDPVNMARDDGPGPATSAPPAKPLPDRHDRQPSAHSQERPCGEPRFQNPAAGRAVAASLRHVADTSTNDHVQ